MPEIFSQRWVRIDWAPEGHRNGWIQRNGKAPRRLPQLHISILREIEPGIVGDHVVVAHVRADEFLRCLAFFDPVLKVRKIVDGGGSRAAVAVLHPWNHEAWQSSGLPPTCEIRRSQALAPPSGILIRRLRVGSLQKKRGKEQEDRRFDQRWFLQWGTNPNNLRGVRSSETAK